MGLQGTKVGSAYIEITAKTDEFKRKAAEVEAQTKRTADSIRTGMKRTEDMLDIERQLIE